MPRRLLLLAVLLGVSSVTVRPQVLDATSTVLEHAHVIFGDATPPLASGTIVMQRGRITAIGPDGQVTIPQNATRVDLTGKWVMPALVNAHVHIGYEGYTSWSAKNYTPENVFNHLQREAYYGVGATQTVGSSPTDASLEFVQMQAAGQYRPASRFLFIPGMAPPNGGPDAILIKGTKELNAVYEVSTGAQAAEVVKELSSRGIGSVKIWVDDRRGTYPKMSPDVYNAVIREAHARGMKVHAHAIQMADQKIVLAAGADVLVHTVGNEPIDDELKALVRRTRPYWTTVIGLGDRSEACNHDAFIDDTYPAAALEEIHAKDCGAPNANAANRERALANNVRAMVDAGARLALGTDAGIDARHAFGWADHHEMSRWVDLGVTPAEAIVAATSRPAELLGLTDAGTLKGGKRADVLVLNADPLANIRNTRQIHAVYLGGVALDRAALAAKFRAAR